MDRRFCAAAARTRLDRGPHRRDRVSLGGRTHRALCRDRGRVRAAQGRRHRHAWPAQSPPQAGDIGHPDRLRDRGGPGWRPAWSRAWRDRAATSPACRSRHTDLAGKRLELLREIIPGLRRLGIMANVGYPASVREMGEVQAAARTLGLEVDSWKSGAPRTSRPPSRRSRAGADALYVCADPLVNANRARINTLALGARLPTMYPDRDVSSKREV